MVISVFPDVSQGFARYEQSRRGRLQDQALRTQNNMMQRRQAAFQDMVAGLEGQEQQIAEVMGLDYGTYAAQRDAARQAAEQEAAAAAQEAAAAAREQQVAFLEDWGGRYARERATLGDEFDESAFMRNARVAATTSGVPMSRPDDPNALPEAIRSYSAGVEVNSQGRFETVMVDGVRMQRGPDGRYVAMPEEQTTAFRTRDALARAGGLEPGTREYEEFMLGEQTSPIDVLTLALAERMAPTPPVNDDVVGRGLTNQQIQVSGVVQDLQSIRETYNPQFTEIPTRVLQAAGALGERLGIESSPEEQALARQYFAWRANSSRTLNNYVRAMTGAQVAVAEFPRMAQVVPYAGTGILDGDSASQFGAKLEAFEQATALAMFRYNYLLRDANIDPQFQEREIQLPGGDTETRLVATNPQFLELQRQYGIFGDNVPATRNLMRSRLESIAQQVDQEMPDSSEAERDREALRRFTTRYAISPAMALSVME